jgi:TolB protein
MAWFRLWLRSISHKTSFSDQEITENSARDQDETMVNRGLRRDVVVVQKEDQIMKKHYGFLVAAMLVGLGVPAVAQQVVSTIAFASTRDDPDGTFLINTNEIYLIDYLTDGTFSTARRLTENSDADFFATLSPDGKGRIVFDSNRRRGAGEPDNTSDLFLMNRKGHGQTFLTRGGSPTWAPPGPHSHVSKMIAFHASRTGMGLPISDFPGAATEDSDIFVVNIDDLLEYGAQPQNITNNPNAIDDDPDWSPDGDQIVFTSHDVNDNSTNATSAEIYVMNADGTGVPKQLTFNSEEERGADWSPDGTRIVFSCRRGGTDFEICVMNADGTGQTQLTFNTVGDLSPSWSPDGQLIVFQRAFGGSQRNQLVVIHPDGHEQQVTAPPGLNRFASWGVIEVGQGQREQ